MDHVKQIMTAMTLAGFGLECERDYQALLVVAEVAKQMHDHREYDPRRIADGLVADARERHDDPAHHIIGVRDSGTIQ
jgi:hypothetical protein